MRRTSGLAESLFIGSRDRDAVAMPSTPRANVASFGPTMFQNLPALGKFPQRLLICPPSSKSIRSLSLLPYLSRGSDKLGFEPEASAYIDPASRTRRQPKAPGSHLERARHTACFPTLIPTHCLESITSGGGVR